MRCIVCDRCKTIIEDMKRCRVITCARPLKPDGADKPPYRGNDRQHNDIIWEKEICSSCLDELESFFDSETPGDLSGGVTEEDNPADTQ